MFATTRRPKPGPTDVYRLYGRRGDLLYIGITNSTYHRFAQHAADKHWWSQVDPARTTVTQYPTRNQALRAEEYAIKAELPAYNKVHHPAWGGTYVGERPASRVSSPFIAAAVCLGLLIGSWVGGWWIPVGPQVALAFFAVLAIRLGWLRR
jgi:predicted GIY-YIG superfamily endonuclease